VRSIYFLKYIGLVLIYEIPETKVVLSISVAYYSYEQLLTKLIKLWGMLYAKASIILPVCFLALTEDVVSLLV
jgi:hypothetical protein